MIVDKPATIIRCDSIENISREKIECYFRENGEDTIIEVYNGGDIFHVTYDMVKFNRPYMDIRRPFGEDMFQEAAFASGQHYMTISQDVDGNPVAVLKYMESYYDHTYKYDGGLDMTFLNRYDCLLFFGVNEYSMELYRRALPLWTGKKVMLCAGNWDLYLKLFPEYENLEIKICRELTEENLARETDGYNALLIQEFLPENEDNSRYEKGVMSYDEVMTLTFMFSVQFQAGEKFPDKKFFVIDGRFVIEGIFGIWEKVFTAARYAKSKGYIPIFAIMSSDYNMYSDKAGDDIWAKFFYQPEGYSLEDALYSKSVTVSPNMNVLNIMRYIMNQQSQGTELTWPSGMFNQTVEEYIAERRKKILTDPEHTLGVLIRGTDYKKTHLPGHPIHADTDQVIDKIKEREALRGEYAWIYLATEDQEVYQKMKEVYGNRLIANDQERFSIEEGQLLVDVHLKKQKEQGRGFRLGAEYLCTLRLLSECESLIASGSCCGVAEAIRENAGKYKSTFVFDLGVNPRE